MIQVWLDLAKIYTLQGEHARTMEALAQARTLSTEVYPAEFNPVQVVAEYLAGRMLLAEQNFQEVNEVADRIRELVTEYGGDRVLMNFYHLLLAELHLDKGDGGAASSQLVQLSSWMARNYPNSVTLMARAKALTGNTRSAIEIYEKLYNNIIHKNDSEGGDFFDYFAERPKVNYYLAQLYEKQGEAEKARKYYSTFLDLWKNADPDLPDLIDAKERLAGLKEMTQKNNL